MKIASKVPYPYPYTVSLIVNQCRFVIMEPILIQYYQLTKVHSLLIYLYFFPNILFVAIVLECHPVCHITYSCHVFLGFLGYDSFSDFPCLWWPWQCSVILVRCFVECPSIGICLFFSWLKWGYMGVPRGSVG